MSRNVSTLWCFAIVAGAMLSVSVTAVLAQQQPPRRTAFARGFPPGTRPPKSKRVARLPGTCRGWRLLAVLYLW